MSNWNIEIWESGEVYSSDGVIPRPNSNMETQEISTMQKIKLSDGDNAFMTPETKYLKEPFQMFFANTTSDFRTKIRNYIRNQDKVKIITNLSEEFIGKFISMSRVWFSGREDAFDLQVSFEQME